MILFEANDPERDPGSAAIPPIVRMRFELNRPVSETHTLPVRGQPFRYPFDRYRLWLGIQEEGEPDQRRLLQFTVCDQLARFALPDPPALTVTDERGLRECATVLSFERPHYLQTLTVLLVVLIGVVAAYAVLLRPFKDLIINAGALVLGVWGIRGILVQQGIQFYSLVDYTLALVIMFVLFAITVRAIIYVEGQAKARRAGSVPSGDAD